MTEISGSRIFQRSVAAALAHPRGHSADDIDPLLHQSTRRGALQLAVGPGKREHRVSRDPRHHFSVTSVPVASVSLTSFSGERVGVSSNPAPRGVALPWNIPLAPRAHRPWPAALGSVRCRSRDVE